MGPKLAHMKFRTVIYRKGVDIMTSLSWTLGALYYNKVCDEGNHIQGYQQHIKCRERVITEVGHLVNDLLHEEFKQQSFSESQHAQLDPSLNIDQYLEAVNPF